MTLLIMLFKGLLLMALAFAIVLHARGARGLKTLDNHPENRERGRAAEGADRCGSPRLTSAPTIAAS